ncbi:glutathione peroxidase [Pseudomonas sp. 13B_2.1_Bac1]|uniref:glutathione peroxidase n=1 Tax=Pseudomonas sp. 13B_2.1_Bac1 TaxID=2971624 RepID=UPI0021C6C31F|nr:glutathione peroxidase [Pseudomonas sp. 13B_2.1_Bac1]MCU1785196.1 glutathione peroxidase [Pseudomonas sp. 13B_2.1_Bac1]
MSDSIYQIPLKRLDGKSATLDEHRGKVLLVVNVASQCGLTPQYVGLESLRERFAPNGFQVLGFPCNDFGGQEPGSSEEIAGFCTLNYSVQFPMYKKIEVNGESRHPLYAALIAEQPSRTSSGDKTMFSMLEKHNLLPKFSSDIAWNFEKFLIDRNGDVVERFAPDIAPEDPVIVKAIEKYLT